MNGKAIYGVFSGNVCLYVGQATNPEARFRYAHAKRFAKKNPVLRILRRVAVNQAKRIEGQVIRSYKKIGQAVFNKRTNLHSGTMDAAEVGKRLRAGRTFTVPTNADRRLALVIAKGAGKTVHSRPFKGGFKIHVME